MKIPFERGIDLVDEKTLVVLADAISAQQTIRSASEPTAAWDAFHQALIRQLEIFGTVSESPTLPTTATFSTANETFHLEADGFCFHRADWLSKDRLFQLQDVVAAHGDHSTLWLSGAAGTPVEDLVFFITQNVILGALLDSTAGACRERLAALNINLA